jgi:calcineurin-like phosphoesterase family protein
MSVWFTADWHLGHANILRLCDRPFPSVDYMDDALISACNELVEPWDTLWILGDFCWRKQQAPEWRERILCHDVRFLQGNHDRAGTGPYAEKVKLSCSQHASRAAYLCHWPWASWQPHTIMLHGHSHGRSPVVPHRFDVGVDATAFRPVDEQTILEMDHWIETMGGGS